MNPTSGNHITPENIHIIPESAEKVRFGKAEGASQDKSELEHFFKFQGRRYALEKRPRVNVGPRDWYYYTRFEIRGQRFFRSMETNNKLAAERKAIEEVIKPALAGDKIKLEAVKLRKKVSTLQEVFELYSRFVRIKPASMRNNKAMFLSMFEWTRGQRVEAEMVPLTDVNKDLVRRYQSAMVDDYVAKAGPEESAQRLAREKALATSKSAFNQAKSIFSDSHELIERYKEAGLNVPDCVGEFLRFKSQGKLSKSVHFAPDDGVLKKTFLEIEGLKETQPEVYKLFWICLGTGMRRSEAGNFKGTDMVERDGRIWVCGGVGKDGKVIDLPVIGKSLHVASATIPCEVLRPFMGKAGFVLEGDLRMRNDTVPAKLNNWLDGLGWKGEKKMHALRAYVGSKIWEKSPRHAQVYLRHKSFATTEDFYSHHARLSHAVDIL